MLFNKNELGTSHGSCQHKAKRLAVLMSAGAEPLLNSGRRLLRIFRKHGNTFNVQYELKQATTLKCLDYSCIDS